MFFDGPRVEEGEDVVDFRPSTVFGQFDGVGILAKLRANTSDGAQESCHVFCSYGPPRCMPLAAELDISWVSFVLHVEQSSRHPERLA